MNLDYNQQFFCATQGFPASGKTTWALGEVRKHPGLVRVNRDSIRLTLGRKFEPKDEDIVTQLRDHAILTGLAAGRSVICDDTNLSSKRLTQLRTLIENAGHRIPFLVNDEFMRVPLTVCIKRDVERDASVGKDVIERMYFDYWRAKEKPANEGIYAAIICDLDGTLAIIPKGANPYVRDFSKDILNKAVETVLDRFALTHIIYLVSGRDATYEKETRDWLDAHDIEYGGLFMRQPRDRRPDHEVKSEIYLNHIQGRGRIEFVLDDRPSMVRFWRANMGLTVLQVAPNWEF